MRRVGLSIVTLAVLVALSGAPGTARGAVGGAELIIPRLHLAASVGSSLAVGPVFYPQTARPGTAATIAIAGHRTTHTHPFWALNELRKGDQIVVLWHRRRHTYRVTSIEVVAPTDWAAVGNVGHERLILSTCTPRFSAAERLLVVALPVKVAA
jgi:sortase A